MQPANVAIMDALLGKDSTDIPDMFAQWLLIHTNTPPTSRATRIAAMLTLNKPILAPFLLLVSTVCTANDDITQEWVRLIKSDFPQGCVIRLDEYLSTTAMNGFRGGAWLVQSCEGNFEYGTSYSPPDVRTDKQRISVSRHRKLDDLTPIQLRRMYSLPI